MFLEKLDMVAKDFFSLCLFFQTFNGEVELARVMTSIGGHPALPQPSLLCTQTRDLKQGCTLI